jgi:hypothetical protein
LIVAAPFVCTLLYLRDPAQGGVYPPCPFHALTGLDCPGCGTLRAAHQLTHGHVRAAFGLNPLAVLLIPIVAYVIVSATLVSVRGRGLPDLTLRGRAAWIVPIVVISFWFARNVPWPPLQWMSAFH